MNITSEINIQHLRSLIKMKKQSLPKKPTSKSNKSQYSKSNSSKIDYKTSSKKTFLKLKFWRENLCKLSKQPINSKYINN